MKKIIILLITLLIIYLPLSTFADEFRIRLHSEPLPNKISIELLFKFEKPSIIYHWFPLESMYPIVNGGLFIECYNVEENRKIPFMSYEKPQPKVPHEQDILKTKEYKEVLKIAPGENYKYSSLKKGRYSLKLIYDTEGLRKYPGGKKLTPIRLESNEIFFEINQ